MEFILASGNSGKAKEFFNLFDSSIIKVLPSNLNLDIDESGETFSENAFLKAQGYYSRLKKPVVSDDSGLIIEKYPQILGVSSARYAPELESYDQKCEKILELMANDQQEKRSAYFVCVLCFFISPEEYYFFEGRLRGEISKKMSGNAGFGYDPIFCPEQQNGLTLAELSDWKMVNSHRAKACLHAQTFFKEHPGQTVKK